MTILKSSLDPNSEDYRAAAEAMSETGGPKNATNDHAIRDDTMLVPWLGTREFGPSGFRFARNAATYRPLIS